MNTPLKIRHAIPFFYDKSEADIRNDPYERFDPTVVRQCALHLVDQLWNGYPMQSVLDFSQAHLPAMDAPAILEIGCGVGRWIATLARDYPKATCWGIDSSYQMLRQANAFWVQGKSLALRMTNKGFADAISIEGYQLPNLQFGLAKASALPFADQSQDVIVHSFLLDRLPDPAAALLEMRRILRPEGTLIFVTPLNFQNPQLWEQYVPPIKLYHSLVKQGFEILDWKDGVNIVEPLDARGNSLHWQVLAVATRRRKG